MHEGGFLFIDGTNRYLREMKDQLREILGSEARLAPVPTSHPLYHSFYEFGGGFPGEDRSRSRYMEGNRSWYYPTNNRNDLVALQQEQAPIVSGTASEQEAEPLQPSEGLWGVELDGELVAVLSDLGFEGKWRASLNTEGEATGISTYALMAGTNILVYALTRKSGITPQLPPPTWMPGQRPVAMVQEAPLAIEVAVADELLFDDLDAWLALVVAPIGSEITEDITVRLDGRYSLELLKRGYQGLLFHNLSAGKHWVELSYGGQDPTGGGRSEGGQSHHADVCAQSLCLCGAAAGAGAGGTGGLAALVCGLCRLGGRGDLLGRRPRVVGRGAVKPLHIPQEHDKQPHVFPFVAILQIHADPCVQHHAIAETDVDIGL